MYYSLHDVLFSSDVIFLSVEQISDRGFNGLQYRVKELEDGSKGDVNRVFTYTVADKIRVRITMARNQRIAALLLSFHFLVGLTV